MEVGGVSRMVRCLAGGAELRGESFDAHDGYVAALRVDAVAMRGDAFALRVDAFDDGG